MNTTELETAAQATDSSQEQQSVLAAITGQTPWWIVSALLHGLVIALTGLISMTVISPKDPEMIVTVTEIIQPAVVVSHAKPELPDARKVLEGADNKEFSNNDGSKILILTDFFPKLSDRDETANGGLSGGGMRGEPDSTVIYNPKGALGETGGGGTDGVELQDQMIGILSEGTLGTGGGFGGGKGKGIGPGIGDGGSTWGRRVPGGRDFLVKKRGGTGHTESAVVKGLAWLAYHQEADGHWDAKKFGGLKVDTAMTSLSLLAFLGAGHTEKVGQHKETVRRAVAWLKSKQAANGLVFDTTDEGGHRGIGYPTAMATMALAEAAGMANVSDTKAAAQKAIDYCCNVHQQGEGSEKLGWRYGPKSAGDISVTGWFIMALKSAKMAGLKVDHQAFEGGIAFLDKCEIKNAGGDASYGPASKYSYTPGSDSNHRRSAIGNLARQFLGWKKADLQASVELFVNDGGVPSWGANGEKVDMYYWYYGTLCVFQQDGDIWRKWNAAMIPTLVDNQCKQGDDAGSWEPKGAFSNEWGRVGQTALATMCLEVYYRY
jgi:hypothetical protein